MTPSARCTLRRLVHANAPICHGKPCISHVRRKLRPQCKLKLLLFCVFDYISLNFFIIKWAQCSAIRIKIPHNKYALANEQYESSVFKMILLSVTLVVSVTREHVALGENEEPMLLV